MNREDKKMYVYFARIEYQYPNPLFDKRVASIIRLPYKVLHEKDLEEVKKCFPCKIRNSSENKIVIDLNFLHEIESD